MREAFEGRYGRMASDRLAAAIATRNCAELESIARLAASTDSGFQAALLLGYVYLDQRQPLEAVGWLQQLAEDPAVRDSYEPQISVRLWPLPGLRRECLTSHKCLLRLREHLPEARIRRGDQDFVLFAAEDPLAVIEELTKSANPLAENANDWPMYRGNPQRNAIASQNALCAGVPEAGRIVVAEPAMSSGSGEKATMYGWEVPPLPALHPLFVKHQPIVRTTERISGLDPDASGLIWHYPPSFDRSISAGSQTLLDDNEKSALQTRWARRVWQDFVYGQMSSDGSLLFAIDDSDCGARSD